MDERKDDPMTPTDQVTVDPTMTDPARRQTGLTGAFTALVTPFTRDGGLDEGAFGRLLAHQLQAGIDGLVPCGTTGESPTLDAAERERIIELTVQATRDEAAMRGTTYRTPVIAGTGTNDTRATIAATRRASELGADAALVVAPYYNKPDQRMLEAHYRAVADEGDLPVVVYNVPGRTGTNVSADTLLRLAEHPRIIAVKEASANLEQIMTILRDRPDGFSVLSGDDSWTFALLALGGDGVISVASNELPEVMVRLCAAARSADWSAARRVHERHLELFRVNFVSPNPVPVKAALAEMGLIEDVVRPPLLPLDDAQRAQLRAVLAKAGVLAPARPSAPVAA
jgi:4-hydroxy-tetrahydrodipicolinate synthase